MVVVNNFSIVGDRIFRSKDEAETYLDENHREATHFEKGVIVSPSDFMNNRALIIKLVNNGYLEYTEFEVIEPFKDYRKGDLVVLNVYNKLYGNHTLPLDKVILK